MHTYSVELRIVGEISEERDISSLMGVRATSFFKKGEPKSPKRQWEQSTWSFGVQPSQDQTEWDSLEKGLISLLHQLLPLKSVIDEIKRSYDVVICCGQFASGFGGGPSFSPELLRKLSQLDIKLTISTYWHEESDLRDVSKK